MVLPSGFGYSRSGPMNTSHGGVVVGVPVAARERPPEISIMFASAPPMKKPFANGWRMLRER